MAKYIRTATTGIKQTFGRFSGLCHPGLNFYIPFIEKITPVSNMIQNKDFHLTVKTKDNVFTSLSIGIQIKIEPKDTVKAFFSLEDPNKQIDTYVQNVVRSKVPQMRLDELFESQGDIGDAVFKHLAEKMNNYGWTIIDTLVNDIKPANEVISAMNKINASERLKEAAINQAEANYIKHVKEAEADKQRKILQGEGISGQRLAILKGYEMGVEDLAKKLGITPRDIMDFVMKTQHLDTIQQIGSSNNAKTIFVNHDPFNSLKNFNKSNGNEIRDFMMQANEVVNT